MPSWLDFSGSLPSLTFGWFDMLVMGLILLGLHFGNRSGASKQVLSFVQWFGTLLVTAFVHEPLGEMVGSLLGVRLWAGRLIAYVTVAVVLLLVCLWINRRISDKVEASAIFGRLEYLIGPVACAVRNVSIVLLLLGAIHGLEVNPAEEKRIEKSQMDSFGMMLYPTPGIIRDAFFKNSGTGKWVGQNLGFLLVTPPGHPQTAGVQQPPR